MCTKRGERKKIQFGPRSQVGPRAEKTSPVFGPPISHAACMFLPVHFLTCLPSSFIPFFFLFSFSFLSFSTVLLLASFVNRFCGFFCSTPFLRPGVVSLSYLLSCAERPHRNSNFYLSTTCLLLVYFGK